MICFVYVVYFSVSTLAAYIINMANKVVYIWYFITSCRARATQYVETTRQITET